MLRTAREGSPSTPAQGSPGLKKCKKQQYLQGFLDKTCKNHSIYKVFCKNVTGNRNQKWRCWVPLAWELRIGWCNKFCNRKSEIAKPGSPNTYESCNCNVIWESRNRKPEIWTNDSRLRKRLRETHNAKLQISKSKTGNLKSEIWHVKNKSRTAKCETYNDK